MSITQPEGERLRKAAMGGIGLMAAIFIGLTPLSATAESVQDVKSQLSTANAHAAETSERISDTTTQLAAVQQRIADTQTNIANTNQAIADARARMAAKQAILDELVKREYQRNRESKLELLASSKSFSEFVDRDTYLKSGQDKIADVVNEVVRTRKELETKSADLSKLNTQLAEAQNGLAFAKAQAENQLDQINASRDALKSKLAKYRSGKVVNAGDHVNAGDLIGFEGTSGCSTGPHLHFEVQRGGVPINPRIVTPGRLSWPLDGGFGINQEFGPPNWAAPYSFHTGIDMTQYFGAPVYAAASGTVVFSGYDRTGFGDHVIINHGDLMTIYGHLGPRGSDYPSC